MKLSGLQKLTLLDYPERTACTVFTAGCNFRCPFCHNALLVLEPEKFPDLPEEEFFSFLKKRQGLLDGVCITGGEPTLQKDLPAFCARIRELGYDVKLDTNGTRPELLRELLEKGLTQYVAMDIKNSPARYAETAGLSSFDLSPVRESVSLLREGSVPYEFRTTAVKELHTPEDFAEIGKWLQGVPRYFIQVFKDSGELIGSGFSAHSREELDACLKAVLPYIPAAQIRGQ